MGEVRQGNSRIVVTEAMDSAWRAFVERRPSELVLVGGGGYGKTTALHWLGDRLTAEGLDVGVGVQVTGHDKDVLLLDDAAPGTDRPGARSGRTPSVIRTSRTADRGRRAPGSDSVNVFLDLWISDDIAEACRVLGRDAQDVDVSTALQWTEGVPWLAWQWLSGRGVDDTLVRHVLRQFAQASPGAIDVLVSLACGHPLSAEGVSAAGMVSDSGELEEALTALCDLGLTTASGKLPRLIRQVIFEHGPRHRVVPRIAERLAAAAVVGSDVEDALGEDMALAGVTDARLAAGLERQGDGAMARDPQTAARKFAAAVAVGGPSARLHARMAEALVRSGDIHGAQEALAPWHDVSASGRDEHDMLDVVSTVSALQGRAQTAADLWLWRIGEGAGMSAEQEALACLTLIAVGDGRAARAVIRQPASSLASPSAAARREMARAMLDSLEPEPARAVARLIRASGELAAAQDPGLLPDHPATLAALLAISMGDVGLARTALDSMVKGGFGPLDKARALVLTAWIDLSEGHYQRVEESLARTDLESPRDDVWWWALRLGLARRRDDLTGLSALWGQARSVLMATPVNLWNILPMAELGVTAARLHEGELATPMWEAGTAIVASLGGVAWGPPFHWAGIQAGILASRPKALGPHAAALVSAARRSHHASVLAEAGRTWVAVLARDVDRYAVVEAAMGLAGISQAWEGARLAAHAAARAADRRDTAVLLECARDLKFPQDAPDPSRSVSSGNDLPVGAIELTAREREVTELVVAGLTYREVASRLFLSAKTVEHHMARIKRRSGAETRGELLHRLSITMSASTGNHVRSGLE